VEEEPETEQNGTGAEESARKAPRGKKGGKRKKPSNIEAHANGDNLDVDINGINQTSRAESEAIVTDVDSPAIEEPPPPTTADVGESIQVETDKVTTLAPGTTYINVNTPGSTITAMAWNPFKPFIMVSGHSLLRLYAVSTTTTLDSVTGPKFKDYPLPSTSSNITAFQWKDEGDGILAAFGSTSNENGEIKSVTQLRLLSEPYSPNHTVIINGVVQLVRWNQSQDRVLAVSYSDGLHSIAIWTLADQTFSSPLSLTIAETIVDATWLNQGRFAICGDKLLKIFEVTDGRILETFSEETVGFWDKLRYDPVCSLLACASTESNKIALTNGEYPIRETADLGEGGLTDIEFQPIINPASYIEGSQRLLATAFGNGTIQLWNAVSPFTPLYRLTMDGSPAISISFSPDGYVLAGAGNGSVVIWNAENGRLPKATWSWEESTDVAINGSLEQPNGSDAMDIDKPELPNETKLQTLSWDSDGKRIAYCIGNRVSSVSYIKLWMCQSNTVPDCHHQFPEVIQLELQFG
jgi:transducin (beta)-like 1